MASTEMFTTRGSATSYYSLHSPQVYQVDMLCEFRVMYDDMRLEMGGTNTNMWERSSLNEGKERFIVILSSDGDIIAEEMTWKI